MWIITRGAQKLLDMYLVPGSTIKFRYYLKSHLPFEYFKVRIAAGPAGKIDYTFQNPPLNRWVWAEVSFSDFLKENPQLSGEKYILVNALAFLGKVPLADPSMPFYLGLDDIAVNAMRIPEFRFSAPEMYKLSEWNPYIPKKHYRSGDTLDVKGNWPCNAEKTYLTIVSFSDTSKVFFKTDLTRQNGVWELKPLKLSFPAGLYLARVKGMENNTPFAETEFTIHIVPDGIGGKHPRLWFDNQKRNELKTKLATDRFKKLREEILSTAEKQREQVPADKLAFDLDQFPDETWLPTWEAWGSHIYPTDQSLYWNSLAWSLCDDKIAGEYAKNVLLKLAGFENWTHPWQTKRGRYSEHRTGSWSHRLALAYDLTYDLMTETERKQIRRALMDNTVKGAHKSYVVDNNIISNTSNWIAMVAGGSLMLQAAMFGDGPDTEYLEPYFTGAAMKLDTFLNRVTDPDGAWGEGYGYNSYSFSNLSNSLPAMMNVFNIDLSAPLKNSYKEYIWSGLIESKKYFHFGDSGGDLGPASSWNWLLSRYKDPMLKWYCDYLKSGETVMDLLYDNTGIPKQEPFAENPCHLFQNVGTTVFKSGWKKDDFAFVMRTGPFYNHQHIDQGTFWLADQGIVFFGERSGSTYYDDPIYQPWYTQPVAHSTILVDSNNQSQRVGDHQSFAGGFDDYAYVANFLDGRDAAFVSGDIGRLYWGKVNSLARNVLYIKPRTLLMLDTASPSLNDAEITLLYQTQRLGDIIPSGTVSKITKDGKTLSLMHLSPENPDVKAVETPHYLYTIKNKTNDPLVKEGMLTVSAKTAGKPLVMANLLTTLPVDESSLGITRSDGYVSGKTGETAFAYSTAPGSVYSAHSIETDAAAFTIKGDVVFAALVKSLKKNGAVLATSTEPVTIECSPGIMKYSVGKDTEMNIGANSKPSALKLNGKPLEKFEYVSGSKTIKVHVPKGEGKIEF